LYRFICQKAPYALGCVSKIETPAFLKSKISVAQFEDTPLMAAAAADVAKIQHRFSPGKAG